MIVGKDGGLSRHVAIEKCECAGGRELLPPAQTGKHSARGAEPVFNTWIARHDVLAEARAIQHGAARHHRGRHRDTYGSEDRTHDVVEPTGSGDLLACHTAQCSRGQGDEDETEPHALPDLWN